MNPKLGGLGGDDLERHQITLVSSSPSPLLISENVIVATTTNDEEVI